MLRTIVKKEIQNNLYSFRFLVSFALLLVTVTITVFILTNDYLKKVDEFSQRQAEIENYLRNYAHFNRIGNVLQPTQPPIPFYALVRGLSSDTNIENFDDDPLPVMFPLLDLTFIVTLLMSLIALVFSYDSLSGEKEDGTLKLMISNGLSRSKVILGKIAGGTLTLLLPFLLALIVGMLIILLNPRVVWSGADWGALGLVFLGSVLYFVFFYCLGIFVSSRHHSSSASIMTSLFVWVLLVLVIPNLSPYFASFFSPTPSRIKIGREAARLTDTDRDDLGRKLMRERLQAVIKKYPVLKEELSESEAKYRVAKDPAFREAYEARTNEIQAAWEEANRIQGAKADALWNEVKRREKAQTELSQYISMISPFADYSYLATDLSSTGIRNKIHFGRIREAWDRTFRQYARQKMSSLQKQNPAVDWVNTPVDMSDRPKFQYKEEDLGGKVKSALPSFALLAAYCFIFLVSAYFSFIRYDVR
jgi:ABC-type transport system involved in multi-copper enzyme maturation permease subunit